MLRPEPEELVDKPLLGFSQAAERLAQIVNCWWLLGTECRVADRLARGSQSLLKFNSFSEPRNVASARRDRQTSYPKGVALVGVAAQRAEVQRSAQTPINDGQRRRRH